MPATIACVHVGSSAYADTILQCTRPSLLSFPPTFFFGLSSHDPNTHETNTVHPRLQVVLDFRILTKFWALDLWDARALWDPVHQSVQTGAMAFRLRQQATLATCYPPWAFHFLFFRRHGSPRAVPNYVHGQLESQKQPFPDFAPRRKGKNGI